jgi:hypothetical protein
VPILLGVHPVILCARPGLGINDTEREMSHPLSEGRGHRDHWMLGDALPAMTLDVCICVSLRR